MARSGRDALQSTSCLHAQGAVMTTRLYTAASDQMGLYQGVLSKNGWLPLMLLWWRSITVRTPMRFVRHR